MRQFFVQIPWRLVVGCRPPLFSNCQIPPLEFKISGTGECRIKNGSGMMRMKVSSFDYLYFSYLLICYYLCIQKMTFKYKGLGLMSRCWNGGAVGESGRVLTLIGNFGLAGREYPPLQLFLHSKWSEKLHFAWLVSFFLGFPSPSLYQLPHLLHMRP